jgi:hypothetical protein
VHGCKITLQIPDSSIARKSTGVPSSLSLSIMNSPLPALFPRRVDAPRQDRDSPKPQAPNLQGGESERIRSQNVEERPEAGRTIVDGVYEGKESENGKQAVSWRTREQSRTDTLALYQNIIPDQGAVGDKKVVPDCGLEMARQESKAQVESMAYSGSKKSQDNDGIQEEGAATSLDLSIERTLPEQESRDTNIGTERGLTPDSLRTDVDDKVQELQATVGATEIRVGREMSAASEHFPEISKRVQELRDERKALQRQELCNIEDEFDQDQSTLKDTRKGQERGESSWASLETEYSSIFEQVHVHGHAGTKNENHENLRIMSVSQEETARYHRDEPMDVAESEHAEIKRRNQMLQAHEEILRRQMESLQVLRELEQEMCGIGLQFKSCNDMPVVRRIKPDSPCLGLDISEGDILVQVDGTRIAKGTKAADIFNLIQGPRGSFVGISLLRPPKAQSCPSAPPAAYERKFQVVRQMPNVPAPKSEPSLQSPRPSAGNKTFEVKAKVRKMWAAEDQGLEKGRAETASVESGKEVDQQKDLLLRENSEMRSERERLLVETRLQEEKTRLARQNASYAVMGEMQKELWERDKGGSQMQPAEAALVGGDDKEIRLEFSAQQSAMEPIHSRYRHAVGSVRLHEWVEQASMAGQDVSTSRNAQEAAEIHEDKDTITAVHPNTGDEQKVAGRQGELQPARVFSPASEEVYDGDDMLRESSMQKELRLKHQAILLRKGLEDSAESGWWNIREDSQGRSVRHNVSASKDATGAQWLGGAVMGFLSFLGEAAQEDSEDFPLPPPLHFPDPLPLHVALPDTKSEEGEGGGDHDDMDPGEFGEIRDDFKALGSGRLKHRKMAQSHTLESFGTSVQGATVSSTDLSSFGHCEQGPAVCEEVAEAGRSAISLPAAAAAAAAAASAAANAVAVLSSSPSQQSSPGTLALFVNRERWMFLFVAHLVFQRMSVMLPFCLSLTLVTGRKLAVKTRAEKEQELEDVHDFLYQVGLRSLALSVNLPLTESEIQGSKVCCHWMFDTNAMRLWSCARANMKMNIVLEADLTWNF